MEINFEGLIFDLPSSTLLSGSMATAKPLFAQKFIVTLLNKLDGLKVAYFATSSPVCGILRNLKIFGLRDNLEKRIVFFDYNPLCNELKRVDENYYVGNFSDVDQFESALTYAGEKSAIVIPSFTLLLVGSDNKLELTDVLVKNVLNQDTTSFTAVNSLMFEEINTLLEDAVDNVLKFTRKERKIYFRVLKFRGRVSKREMPFEFPVNMFQRTKKEVAERTSRIIREKKGMRHVNSR